MSAQTKFPPYSYSNDPLIPSFPDDKPIIVFDGYCALCSGWAKFVLRHDKKQRFRLLPAQTPLGQAIYSHYGLYTTDFESNILIDQGQAWLKSAGSIRMAQGLGFPWSLAIVLKLIPTSMLDVVYGWVARNRFKWFGRLESCYVPKEEFKSRFLA